MSVPISLTVNGQAVNVSVDPRTLLVQLIRENLQLTGTHVGCDTAQCGACTVHLDGRAVKSCNMLAVQAAGREAPRVQRGASFATRGRLRCAQARSGQAPGDDEVFCGFRSCAA